MAPNLARTIDARLRLCLAVNTEAQALRIAEQPTPLG